MHITLKIVMRIIHLHLHPYLHNPIVECTQL
jgi:hypothetical protein